MSDDQRRILILERLIAEQQELISTQREAIERQGAIIDRLTRSPGLTMTAKQTKPRRGRPPGRKSGRNKDDLLADIDRLLAFRDMHGYTTEEAIVQRLSGVCLSKTRTQKATIRGISKRLANFIRNRNRLK